jgi:hypothetical protein
VAETYWPFDSGSGASSGEDRWYAMAPLWALDGPTTAAGLLVTILSGRNLQVAIGDAWVHGGFYRNDAAKSLAIAANASGNPRIDRIVLRRDLSANTVTAVVVQGTAAASPVAPALTQVPTGIWEVPVCQYRAETGFVNTDALKLTDERCPAGARFIGTGYSAFATNPGTASHTSGAATTVCTASVTLPALPAGTAVECIAAARLVTTPGGVGAIIDITNTDQGNAYSFGGSVGYGMTLTKRKTTGLVGAQSFALTIATTVSSNTVSIVASTLAVRVV